MLRCLRERGRGARRTGPESTPVAGRGGGGMAAQLAVEETARAEAGSGFRCPAPAAEVGPAGVGWRTVRHRSEPRRVAGVAGVGGGAAGANRFTSDHRPSTGLTAASGPVPGALARSGVPWRILRGDAVPCTSGAGPGFGPAGNGPARPRRTPAAWDTDVRAAARATALASDGWPPPTAGRRGGALITADAVIPAARATGRGTRRGRGPPPARGRLTAALRAHPMIEGCPPSGPPAADAEEARQTMATGVAHSLTRRRVIESAAVVAGGGAVADAAVACRAGGEPGGDGPWRARGRPFLSGRPL